MPALRSGIMKKLIALVSVGVALAGCAGQSSEEEAEGTTEALSETLDFNVFGLRQARGGRELSHVA